MAIGINDLDWDDDLDEIEESNTQTEEENPSLNENNLDEVTPQDKNEDNTNSDTEDDLITFMLKSKGIQDPSKIKFENEDGNIEELDWNSLTRDEQLNILQTLESNNLQETDLDDEEILLINKIRYNKISPKEYEQYLIQQGANNYQKSLEETTKTYKVDDLSDDELFILDLQTRIEDLSEEQAGNFLEQIKKDENLYQKQVKGIREEYRRLEKESEQQELYEQQVKQEEEFKQFSNQIQSSIRNFNKVGDTSIDLDDDDAEDIAQFLLTKDPAGINYFSKALNDPDQLVKMAWFTLKGEQAFNDIANYFAQEIKNHEKASYQKGLEDAKKENPKPKQVVYQPINNNIINNKNHQFTIDDLD